MCIPTRMCKFCVTNMMYWSHHGWRSAVTAVTGVPGEGSWHFGAGLAPSSSFTDKSCIRWGTMVNNEVLAWVTSVKTHWGRVTHICIGNLTIIGSDNGLSPERRQAIIWTNAGILLIGPLGTNFSEISIGIQTFSFKKMHFKMSSAKWRPFCLDLNVLTILM